MPDYNYFHNVEKLFNQQPSPKPQKTVLTLEFENVSEEAARKIVTDAFEAYKNKKPIEFFDDVLPETPEGIDKKEVRIPVDVDVLDYFKSLGPYGRRMNNVLRAYMNKQNS